MLEGLCSVVLLVVVAMMLGIIEVPSARSTLKAFREPREPRETKRVRDHATMAGFQVQEMSRLRRQFRSRLQ